jgi:hypothetical protein
MTEHYCELHEWKTIGTASTSNGLLALVAPYYAATLGKWWDRTVGLPPHEFRKWHDAHRNFEHLKLRQATAKHDGTSYTDSEQALLVACENGPYDVQARFCDLYSDGHLSVCEVRINLHWAEHADDQDEDDGLLHEVEP